MSIRTVLSAIALCFALYQAARGLIWTNAAPESPALLFVAVAIYVVATAVCVLAVERPEPGGPIRKEPMPAWAALAMLGVAVVLPTFTGLAIGTQNGLPTYGTWYIGGLGALMVVVMVRQRPLIAWIGTAVLTAMAMFWMGPLKALGQGLVGSIVWVGIAHLLVVLIQRAERDAAQLVELQSMTTAWEAGQDARERERRVQLQRALAVGGPILTRVIAMHGSLTDDERREAGMAEARLRDELRGPRLLDDDVRSAIEAARRRGSHVSVFDEGGLDALTDDELTIVRATLAQTLQDANSQRVIIRTSVHERTVVTVVGRSRAGTDAEETVDLWREIEHP